MSHNFSTLIEATQKGLSLEEFERTMSEFQRYNWFHNRLFVLHNFELQSSSIPLIVNAIRESLVTNESMGYTLVLQHVLVAPEIFSQLLQELQVLHNEYRGVLDRQDLERNFGLWCHLIFNTLQLTDASALELAERFADERLYSLDLSYNELTPKGALAILSKLKHLLKCDLSHNQIDSSLLRDLNGSTVWSRIRFLDLQNPGWKDEDSKTVLQAVVAAQGTANVFLRGSIQTRHWIEYQHTPGLHDEHLSSARSIYYPYFNKAIVYWIIDTCERQALQQFPNVYEEGFTDDQESLNDMVMNVHHIIDKPNSPTDISLATFERIPYVFKQARALLAYANTPLKGFSPPVSLDMGPEYFQQYLTWLRTAEIQVLEINIAKLSSNEFAQLCEVIAEHPTLQELNFVGPHWDANQVESLSLVVRRNFTLKKVHDNWSEVPHKDVLLGAIRCNYTLSQLLSLTCDTLNNNNRRDQLDWRERDNEKRKIIAQIPEDEAQKQKRYAALKIPSLTELAKQALEKTHPQFKTLTPSEIVEHRDYLMSQPLKDLIEFLDKEIARLQKISGAKAFGRDTKLTLLKQVRASAASPDFSQEHIKNLFRRTAIICHHRRHSLLNNVASFFKAKYKEAESWRQFCKTFPELKLAKDIIDQFRPRKPLSIQMEDGTEQAFSHYQDYRRAMKM